MCLNAKQTIKGFKSEKAVIRLARKDIVVYKILVKCFDKYIAPYRAGFIYHKGLNYPKEPSKKILFEDTLIFGGWLHAYLNEDRARDVAEWSNDVVVKMVIPRGSKYILGTIDDVCASCLKWE